MPVEFSTIAPTAAIARLQGEWILRQARDFWRESHWPSKTALSRERLRKKFLT
jgi:hypothetical protein